MADDQITLEEIKRRAQTAEAYLNRQSGGEAHENLAFVAGVLIELVDQRIALLESALVCEDARDFVLDLTKEAHREGLDG